jgi:hypothetical protein
MHAVSVGSVVLSGFVIFSCGSDEKPMPGSECTLGTCPTQASGATSGGDSTGGGRGGPGGTAGTSEAAGTSGTAGTSGAAGNGGAAGASGAGAGGVSGAGGNADAGASDTGLGSGGNKSHCTWQTRSNDCLANEFCDAPDCSSPGTCASRPEPRGTGEGVWACGCDGVTYWNKAFANAQGVTAPMIGMCGGPSSGGGVTPPAPLACAPGRPCPVQAICVPHAGCPSVGQAACWAWPNDYVCTPGAQLGYKFCDGTGGCLTECEAITSLKPYSMSTINCR